jgi:hypothetical protein
MCPEIRHAMKTFRVSYAKLDKFTASALDGAKCSVSPSRCYKVSLTEGGFSARYKEGCGEPEAGFGMMKKGHHTCWESNAHCPFCNQQFYTCCGLVTTYGQYIPPKCW